MRYLKWSSALFLLLFSYTIQAQYYSDMTELVGFNDDGRNHGVAIADINNDGLDDIYFSRKSAANKLYINRGNFQFEEVSGEFGVDYAGDTNCSLFWDFDNDGDQDLFLGNKFDYTKLYRNDGAMFTDVTETMGIASHGNLRSLNAADIDNDGDLDLYVAYTQKQNVLWRNDGDTFTNIIDDSGIDDSKSSMAAIFFDYNEDGLIDLYQTRDGDQGNLMYKNLGDGKFQDVSDETGTGYKGQGMGVDVGDMNNDGLLDLYITNLYDNVLLANIGNGRFVNVTGQKPISDRGMGWGTLLFDVNNDGLKDIYVANDSTFPVEEEDLPNMLYINLDHFNFTMNDYVGDIQNVLASYGTASADFDLDGRLDLVIANNLSNNQIFHHQQDEDNHYVDIQLKGVDSNSCGVGAVVEIYYDGQHQKDVMTSGAGYASQSGYKLHFGMGTYESIDSVIVTWPSGLVQKSNATVDEINVIEEGKGQFKRGPLVWTEPPFPTHVDDVTVYFDAREGNGALAGFDGQVFAHTGLITNQSTAPNDWKNVVGNWGQFDSRVIMTDEGDDIYSISYNIEDYYSINTGTVVEQLAFVFRNVDGTIVGRDTDGSDIFLDIFQGGSALLLNLVSPSNTQNQIIFSDDSLYVDLRLNMAADVVITDNNVEIYSENTDLVEVYLKPDAPGEHSVTITATLDQEVETIQFKYFVIDRIDERLDPPAGTRPGLNYTTSSSYTFALMAPNKSSVFLLCPNNNFSIDGNFRLNQSTNGDMFWIELPRTLFENGNNTYQYLVDGSVTIADPYAEVVLDPWNDQWVDPNVLIDLPEYPENAQGILTAFDLDKREFDWEIDSFDKPLKTDLVVYEVLIRDFVEDRRYTSLIDTLDYLQDLGVNAIELMPIQEFEANDSWGYNPSFHMAVDKYYGSREELRTLIDEAHKRGIAVILDVVFNHAFSQSPLAQLYWDQGAFRPTPDSPFLNVIEKHPFNVGYDFNHESPYTKSWVKRVLEHWITEFKFDGFRFDLSKGLTQTDSGADVGFWGSYDASRIRILKEYSDFIWSLDPTSYVIMEHFANNDEETELANYGMMMWGNMNHQFNDAVMGFKSDLEWTDYKVRGWNDPHIMAYMESHDEERLMYRSLRFGDVEGDYSTRELNTALDRVAAAYALFMSIPGPKMLWQFGEMGYDYSINTCVNGSVSDNCRLDPKPIRWDYLDDYYRNRLKETIKAIHDLKVNYPTFETRDYDFNDGNLYLKTVHLNHEDMDAVTLVNFRVTDTEINPKFQYPGTWYEYFSGDSLVVENVNEKLPFGPGEFRIYTSERISDPSGIISSTSEIIAHEDVLIFPNPVTAGGPLFIQELGSHKYEEAEIRTIDGKLIRKINVNNQQVDIPYGLESGMYLLNLISKEGIKVEKIIVN